jgi:hypothetical protein
MITGAHAILHSRDAEADRAFLRDVLGFTSVDAGQGWLIFGLPPSELAVHPGEKSLHQLYLLTDDVMKLTKDLAGRGVTCGPVLDRGWGLLTELPLPGGGVLGVYQPRHPRPAPVRRGLALPLGRAPAGKHKAVPVRKRAARPAGSGRPKRGR